MRAIPLLAALLAPPSAAAEPCDYEPRPASARQWTAADPECRFMRALGARFETLRAAAGVSGVKFSGYVATLPVYPTAEYKDGWVVLNTALVECFMPDLDAATGVVAHELAHARQWADGVLPKAWHTWTDAGQLENNRRIEYDADQRAERIVRLAGFPEATMARVNAAFVRCHPQVDRYRALQRHPPESVRWIESVRAGERAKAAAGLLPWQEIGPDGLPPRSAADQSRLAAGIPAPYGRPQPGGVVPLPDGGLWEVPAHLRQYSPAELMVFAARGGGTPPASVAEAFPASLEAVRRMNAWGLLPGKVVPPPAQAASPGDIKAVDRLRERERR